MEWSCIFVDLCGGSVKYCIDSIATDFDLIGESGSCFEVPFLTPDGVSCCLAGAASDAVDGMTF